MPVIVHVNWLQHRSPVFDKHGEHLPMVNIFFSRLTFPFSIILLPISTFRFLFLLNAVIGSSCNSPWSVLLILSIFQSFWIMLLMFGEKLLWDNTSGILFCASLSCAFSFRSSFLSIVLTFENYWSTDFLL